jgi:hypothetical protein
MVDFGKSLSLVKSLDSSQQVGALVVELWFVKFCLAQSYLRD